MMILMSFPALSLTTLQSSHLPLGTKAPLTDWRGAEFITCFPPQLFARVAGQEEED